MCNQTEPHAATKQEIELHERHNELKEIKIGGQRLHLKAKLFD